MTLEETLVQLESIGNETVRAQNIRNGAGDNQFGVRLGDIRKLAAKIKLDHELALALWQTGNLDARLLAILLVKPKNLSGEEVDRIPRASQARHRHWRNIGDLSRLSRFQGVHLAVYSCLDQRDGEPAGGSRRTNSHEFRDGTGARPAFRLGYV